MCALVLGKYYVLLMMRISCTQYTIWCSDSLTFFSVVLCWLSKHCWPHRSSPFHINISNTNRRATCETIIHAASTRRCDSPNWKIKTRQRRRISPNAMQMCVLALQVQVHQHPGACGLVWALGDGRHHNQTERHIVCSVLCCVWMPIARECAKMW